MANNLDFDSGSLVSLYENPFLRDAVCVDAATISGRGAMVFMSQTCYQGADNDTCEETVFIVPDVDIYGSNATSTDTSSTSCELLDTAGVYFYFIAPADGYAYASTCGSDLFTTLSVWDACDHEISCSYLGFCGLAEEVLQVVAGTPYIIRIGGITGHRDFYTLRVTVYPDEVEGEYHPSPELDCDEDSLFSQAANSNPYNSGALSDPIVSSSVPFEYVPLENVSITNLRVWAYADSGSGDCVPSELLVQARRDVNGEPAQAYYSRPCTFTRIAMGRSMDGHNVYSYDLEVDPPINVYVGGVWISVSDLGANSCDF